MIGYKKLCLDETDTGDYIDEKGKKYHYRRFSKQKGMGMIQRWADLKFEYVGAFIGLTFLLVVGSLGMVGDAINEAAGICVSAFYMSMPIMCTFTAANSRPKKSLAYLSPITSKDYLRRSSISYMISVMIMIFTLGFGITVAGWIFKGDVSVNLSGLLTFLKRGNMAANLFIFELCLIYIISMLPLLFMEGKERVKRYMRIMLTVFFSIVLLFAGIFYTPSSLPALLRLVIFYGALIILLWIKAWSKVLWGILDIMIVVFFWFEDGVWIDWLFEEDWSIYTMIVRGSGWRNIFVYLLLICALASIPFFLRLAYREVQPYYKMKRAYLQNET